MRESGTASNRRSSTRVACSSRSHGTRWAFFDHRDAKRKGVDEHPDHRLHSSQLRGPAGDCYAEEHVALAAVPGEQDRPGTLDQSAQREPVRPRECLEPGRRIRRQHGVALGNAPTRFVATLRRQTLQPQRRRRGHASQSLPPVLFRLRKVAIAQPGDVIAKRPDRLQCGLHPLRMDSSMSRNSCIRTERHQPSMTA